MKIVCRLICIFSFFFFFFYSLFDQIISIIRFFSFFVTERTIAIAVSSCTWSIRMFFSIKKVSLTHHIFHNLNLEFILNVRRNCWSVRIQCCCISLKFIEMSKPRERGNEKFSKFSLFRRFSSAYCITETPKPTLPYICSELRSDAILISLFRTGAAPMPCPFKGPLEFTYSHGEGECKSPLSAAETCTQESRLLLRYQACANVLSSESVGEYYILKV